MISARLAVACTLLAVVAGGTFDHHGGHHGGGSSHHGGHHGSGHHGGASSSGTFSSGTGKNIVHEIPLTVPSPYAVHEPVYVPIVKKYPVEHHVTIIKKVKVPITTIKKVPIEVIKKVSVPVHVDHHGGYGHH